MLHAVAHSNEMIQLRVLSGKMAGSTAVARRFPFQVGRAPDAGLVLQEAGVWDRHFQIQFERGHGFTVAPLGDAILTINGHSASEKNILRNGDSIEIGGTRLQFWLGETRQTGLRLREGLVWLGIAAMTLAQIVIIYRLLR